MRVARLATILLSAPLSGLAWPALAAPQLAPHRAVYDLALDKASDRSGITGLAGRMVYEFNGSPCEGYTVKFRFVTQIDTSENSRLTDQQTTTFEDGDGKSFNFVTRTFVDQSRTWCGGRMVSALEGGYAPDQVASAVMVHLGALRG